MEAYNNVLQRLNSKTNEERIAYTDSLQVESILSLLTKADLELDQLCETSSTEEEFRSKYETYKDKYDEFFMFNDQDAEDLSAYSKLKNPMDDNIANCKGEYMIGDSLVQSKVFDNFSEFDSSNQISLYGVESTTVFNSTNHAWSHTDDRKVGCYIDMATPSNGIAQINVRFTAQKKYIFGWKRYSTVYFAKFWLNGSGNGFEFYQSTYLSNFVGQEKYVNKDGEIFEIETVELGGNTTLNFGRVTGTKGLMDSDNYYCSGDMYVWSRGVAKENKGGSRVDISKSI